MTDKMTDKTSANSDLILTLCLRLNHFHYMSSKKTTCDSEMKSEIKELYRLVLMLELQELEACHGHGSDG